MRLEPALSLILLSLTLLEFVSAQTIRETEQQFEGPKFAVSEHREQNRVLNFTCYLETMDSLKGSLCGGEILDSQPLSDKERLVRLTCERKLKAKDHKSCRSIISELKVCRLDLFFIRLPTRINQVELADMNACNYSVQFRFFLAGPAFEYRDSPKFVNLLKSANVSLAAVRNTKLDYNQIMSLLHSNFMETKQIMLINNSKLARFEPDSFSSFEDLRVIYLDQRNTGAVMHLESGSIKAKENMRIIKLLGLNFNGGRFSRGAIEIVNFNCRPLSLFVYVNGSNLTYDTMDEEAILLSPGSCDNNRTRSYVVIDLAGNQLTGTLSQHHLRKMFVRAIGSGNVIINWDELQCCLKENAWYFQLIQNSSRVLNSTCSDLHINSNTISNMEEWNKLCNIKHTKFITDTLMYSVIGFSLILVFIVVICICSSPQATKVIVVKASDTSRRHSTSLRRFKAPDEERGSLKRHKSTSRTRGHGSPKQFETIDRTKDEREAPSETAFIAPRESRLIVPTMSNALATNGRRKQSDVKSSRNRGVKSSKRRDASGRNQWSTKSPRSPLG